MEQNNVSQNSLFIGKHFFSQWCQNDFKMISKWFHAMQICQGGNHSTFKWFFHLFWELFFAFLGTIFHFLGTIFCFFGNYFSFFGNYFPFLMVRDFVYHFSGSTESRGPVLSRNKQSQWTCTNGLTRAMKMIIWMCRWFCILHIMYIYCIARWPLVWVVFDGNSICFFLFWGFLYFFDDLLVHILWTKKRNTW